MTLFELDGNGRKLIGEYSKGMRKRVAMAASLIHRPELFLMDEPFEGVDAVGARLMKDILLDQVRQGATIFLTSHVLEVVERFAIASRSSMTGRSSRKAQCPNCGQARKRWRNVCPGSWRRAGGRTPGVAFVIGRQALAIVWAQWRSLANHHGRAGNRRFPITVLFALVWYGLWAFLSFAVARMTADPESIPLLIDAPSQRRC